MSEEQLEERLSQVAACIAAAAQRSGRAARDIKLVAVSKKQPVERMLEFQRCCVRRGLRVIFGESYVQEFKRKRDFLGPELEVHLIGALQSNKVRDAVKIFDVIESVHSLEIAGAVAQEAEKLGKQQAIMAQVNISNDPGKHGFAPDGALHFFQYELPRWPSLQCLGLMTITRWYEKCEEARPDFRALQQLAQTIHSGAGSIRDSKPLELSMGMSHDFEVAIEEGATWVRIGTALFGERC